MAIKINNDITDIDYHFENNVISDDLMTQNLRSLKLENEFIVNQEVEHRPDLLSTQLYDTNIYDWILMFINGLTVDELTLGTVIKYPSLNDLTKFLVS